MTLANKTKKKCKDFAQPTALVNGGQKWRFLALIMSGIAIIAVATGPIGENVLAAISGDINSDGTVGAQDLSIVLSNWGKTKDPPTSTPNPTSTPVQPTPVASVGPIGLAGNWSLQFSDEFNGTSLDPKYWATSWFGGGTMNNVKTSAANVSVSGGNLLLSLKSNSEGALVSTNPSDSATTGFEFSTGYAEARIYFPGQGESVYNWPAWWTDGQRWPTNGEIDIAEGLGTMTSNYHSSSGANNSGTIFGTWAGGWHTYGMNRQAGKNSVYYDGKLVRTYTTNDSNSPHYLIFNIGSGNKSVFGEQSQIKVDYVRVWKQ